jgi:hypothetical protein
MQGSELKYLFEQGDPLESVSFESINPAKGKSIDSVNCIKKINENKYEENEIIISLNMA